MAADDDEYFAEVWEDEQVDRPGGLWHRRGEDMEYWSMIDWSWHPATDDIDLPHPDVLVPIGPDLVQTLLEDRQRFAKYWVAYLEQDDGKSETRVYRQLPSPEGAIEEVFGRGNEWIPTQVVEDFLVGGPHEVPDLSRIDAATAERLINETRGVSGATAL